MNDSALSNPSIIFEPLHEDTQCPHRATEGSAGYDLFAYVRGSRVTCSDGARSWEIESEQRDGSAYLELPPAVTALVPLGFKARLPAGFEAQVRPRSGTTFRKGLLIPNAPGTVDADFPDEWKVLVRNAVAHPVRIEHGERIAQMVLHRFEVLPFEHGRVELTSSRRGGFGSTGH
ncbi:MAG TPA: dUTP diphosphatase [Gemmatimonadaceae bacterium]|nr:dUTP diphosphatase [Gemmatimonadaceae bacterium]